MKKPIIGRIVLIGILVTGILLIIYPTLSNIWNSYHMSQAISNYQSALSGMDEEMVAETLQRAQEYNAHIEERTDTYIPSDDELASYPSQLNIDENGIMGEIEIPRIGVSLPIYHGTEEKVLSLGAGHVAWSALPVGGEGTTCVISGHTGLPSTRLFTDLDKLEVSDRFYLNILGQRFAYEVIEILVVKPEEVEYLLPEEGKDLCILMTCTPYGINSHRLLVKGIRVIETEAEEIEENDREKEIFGKMQIAAGAFFCLILILFLAIKKVRKGK